MGYMTKHWLEGDPQRNRGHNLVEVEVSSSSRLGAPSKDDDVFFSIEVSRDDGNYQVVRFTEDEVGELFSKMVKVAKQSTRINVALAILKRVPDAELLQFFTTLLAKRGKRSERSEGGESGKLDFDWDWDWIDN
jgi:hypothetical protein